jgi:NDP-sugar pyrophosphorylase family protein
MVAIRGGHPYGNNPARHASTTGRKGAPHSNGGGWVDATAHVAASAYVGPAAMVLEQAQVTGKAKIGEQAVVSGNAKVSDNAIVRGHAVVSGNGIIGGNARIEEEASVYGGTVNEDARLGALTLVEDDQTKIHGQADIAAVMNNIRGVDLSGTVRLIGDIELNTSPLSKGVFYGMVTQEMSGNQRWGAERTAAAPEVTAAPARIWPN